MKNLFSMDSKLMQVLGFIADLILLNLLFLLCCLPIVTIGAAQAGLYNAVRILQDREDDSSVFKAFFRGFASGFVKVTGLHLIMLALEAILLVTVYVSMKYEGFITYWVPIIMLIPCLVLHGVITVFHSRFSCTFTQLFRNAWLVMCLRPIRSLAVGVLAWLPAGVLVWSPYLFLELVPLFLIAYYSVAFMFGILIMQKPFQMLIDHFNGDDEDDEEESEEE